MENERIIIAGVMGGSVAAVLNAVPILNFINCFCCIGIMLGGAIALIYYDRSAEYQEYLSPAVAVTLGITSGLIGAFISLFIEWIIFSVFGNWELEVLKDIIVKYKSLRGFSSPYVPGWDCHGMPIEHEAMKQFAGKKVSREEIRKKCREYALRYVAVQKGQFRRLGVFGDWDNSYLTLNPGYEAKVIEVFGELFKN